MKIILLVLLLIVPFIWTKEVESETEQFECIANYLRDKNALEKGFTYFVQSESLDCESFLSENQDVWLNETIAIMLDPDSDEDEIEINFKEMYLSNPTCFHEQLKTLHFVDVIMKTIIYTKSNKLRSRQKKTFLANVHLENVKKILIAVSICFPEKLFGSTFDEIIATSNDENATRDDKLRDYCIRKYVVDNILNEINAHNINLNPDNLDIDSDFDCAKTLENTIDEFVDELRSAFAEGLALSIVQNACMKKVIREKETTNLLFRLGILNEFNLSSEQKLEEKSKYVDFMAKLYVEMAKCL